MGLIMLLINCWNGTMANQRHWGSSHHWGDRLHPPPPMTDSEPRLLRQKHIQAEKTFKCWDIASHAPTPLSPDRVVGDISFLEREGWEGQAESQRVMEGDHGREAGTGCGDLREWEVRRNTKGLRISWGQEGNFKETVKPAKHLADVQWILKGIKSTRSWCSHQPPVRMGLILNPQRGCG